MSNSVQPHRRQANRLPHPWDSLGRNTGVGCHFLLQCMKVKSESEVAQLCPTLRDPMDCSLPGSSIHGIFQARVLEWVPLPSPRKSSRESSKTLGKHRVVGRIFRRGEKTRTAKESGTRCSFTLNLQGNVWRVVSLKL